jgi:hypothetical protein
MGLLFLKTDVTYTYTRFSSQKFYVLCMNLEKGPFISLHSMTWLVLMTETDSVYCEVRTKTLPLIQFDLILQISKFL